MSSRISSSPSLRHPDKFDPPAVLTAGFFVYKYGKTPVFVTGKCRLKVKSAGGNLPGWRQNGGFSDMRIEGKGTRKL